MFRIAAIVALVVDAFYEPAVELARSLEAKSPGGRKLTRDELEAVGARFAAAFRTLVERVEGDPGIVVSRAKPSRGPKRPKPDASLAEVSRAAKAAISQAPPTRVNVDDLRAGGTGMVTSESDDASPSPDGSSTAEE